MSGVKLEAMRISDYEAVIDLWSSAGLEHVPEGRDSRLSMARDLQRPGNLYLLAWDGGELVGSVLCTDDGRKGWINRLAVRPSHQRQGIAKMLVAAAEEHFKTRGIGVFSIIVYRDNAASLALFHDAGYKDHDETVYLSKKMDPKA